MKMKCTLAVSLEGEFEAGGLVRSVGHEAEEQVVVCGLEESRRRGATQTREKRRRQVRPVPQLSEERNKIKDKKGGKYMFI